jgi:signal transduction histidine kinase
MARRERSEVLGRIVKDVFPELVEQGFLDLLNRVYQTGEPFIASAREAILTRAGRDDTVYVDFIYYPMRDLSGVIEGILFQGIDVTEQELARLQLEVRVNERTADLERAEQNLRALTKRLLLAQDEERRRIALELHDSVGQLVAALQWKLVSAQEHVYETGSVMAGYIAGCLGLAEDISKEIRTLSYLLHPSLLGEAGLLPTLQSYIEGMRDRSGLSITLEIDPDLGRFPHDLETAVFRIVQEALTNIHRHARTNEAFVRIHLNLTFLLVEVEDRRQGMADSTPLDRQSPGLGLRGMMERVRQFSGHFEVHSGNSGTTVKATFPIADAPNSSASAGM